MPGRTGFDFNGASQSFNVLAEYLFGKVANTFLYLFYFYSELVIFFRHVQLFHLVLIVFCCLFQNTIIEKMEMTTPVITRKAQANGKKMEMTTPVITKKVLFSEFM